MPRLRLLLPLVLLLAPLCVAAPVLARSGDKDPVVAKVGDTEVRRSEVELMLEIYGRNLTDLPPAKRFEEALERVIDMHLIAQAARRDDLDEDPRVRRDLAEAERQVLQEAFIARLVNRETTEKALRERYKQVYHDGKGIREIKVRHILTFTKGKAEDVIRALDGGADFAQLAREQSVDDATAKKGGELGWLKKDAVAVPFAKAAWPLDVGEYTEKPVETGHGWHVIKIDSERFEKGPSFEEARDELAQSAVEDAISSVLQKLREDVKIERVKDAGADD